MLHRGKNSGFSLMELVVTLGIVSLLLVGVFQVFQEGMQLFRVNLQASDSQRAVVSVLGQITAEVANAIPEVAESYDAASGQPPGIVFATSLDDTGKAHFHPLTAEVYWQRYVCFYFEPDPNPNGFDGKVFRAQVPVPNEHSPPTPPGSRENSISGNIISTFIANNPTSYFQTSGAAQRRQIATGISGFNVEIYDGSEGGHSGPASLLSFDITIEAGSPGALKIRNQYYIKVFSRVTPRG